VGRLLCSEKLEERALWKACEGESRERGLVVGVIYESPEGRKKGRKEDDLR